MVELFEQDIRENGRQSSKGNQLKWKNGDTWYKADYTGYEGLAEYMVSHLLLKSTLRTEEFVLYDLEQIRYKTTVYNGVKSDDFVKDDWQIITLERLFKNFFDESLYKAVFRIADYEGKLRFLVNQVMNLYTDRFAIYNEIKAVFEDFTLCSNTYRFPQRVCFFFICIFMALFRMNTKTFP